MLIQTKETRPKITNMRVVRNWRLDWCVCDGEFEMVVEMPINSTLKK